MSVMERNFTVNNCPPRIPSESEAKGSEWWLAQQGGPKPRLQNEPPPGETIRYEDLLSRWEETR